MTYIEETRRRAKLIRQRLRFPPNAVIDPGIDITRKSSGIKGYESDKPKEPKSPAPPPPNYRIVDTQPPEWPLTLATILTAVANHYGLSVGDLKGRKRARSISHARRTAAYLGVKLLTNRSKASIAREMEKDHTTVLYSCKEMEKVLLTTPILRQTVDYLTEVVSVGQSQH